MERFIQTLLLLLLVGSAVAVGYFTIIGDHEMNVLFSLVFVMLALLYHLILDRPVSRIYILVLFLFLLSSIISVISYYSPRHQGFFIYAIQLFNCMGFLFILIEIIKETRPGTVLNRYGILVFLILVVDALIISKIIELLLVYRLSLDHLFFGFIFTIIKLLLMSAGIISYFISTRKSRKVSFLNGALAAFFLSDLIDTSNYLFFLNDLMQAATFLQSGLSMVGLLLFYVYCTYPNSDPIVDANRL